MRNSYIGFLLFTVLFFHGNLSFGQDTLYWVGGPGSWGEPFHWSTTSGGPGGSIIPGQTKSVVFDQNSFTGNALFKFDQGTAPFITTCECKDMIWRNIPFQITLAGSKPIFIFGMLQYLPNMDFNFTGQTTFAAVNETVTIKTAGNSIPAGVIFDGNNGRFNLLDDFYVLGNFDINSGHVITNSHNVKCIRFNSAPVNPLNFRSIDLGSSLLTIRSMNSLTNISSRITNVNGSMKVYSSGTSKILFTGDITEPGNLCTFDAADSLKFDNIDFMTNGELIADHDTFNDVLFMANGLVRANYSNFHNVTVQGEGIFYVNYCTFNIVDFWHQGLDYSNFSVYNRLLFSTHPHGWGCGDPRNTDIGLLQGNDNLINDLVDFNRNGTIDGTNNTADSCRFLANGWILTGSNAFENIYMERHWHWNMSCSSCYETWAKNILTLQHNKTQSINNKLVLFGDYHCEHTRITTTDSAQQAVMHSTLPLFLDYIEIQGIHATSTIPAPDTAKRSVDLGNNSNWYYLNNYTPVADSLITETDVTPCSYSGNGTVTIWGKGGEKPLKYYKWVPGGYCGGSWVAPIAPDSNRFINLTKGYYTFKITDNYGCENVIVNDTVSGPDPIIIDSVKVIPIPCYNVPPNTNGEIIVYAHGGTGVLKYSVNNGTDYQPDNHFFNIGLQATPYIIRVIDDSLCVSDTVHVRMVQRPSLGLNTYADASVECFGDSTGVISLETWGGTPPYFIRIDPILPKIHPQNTIFDTLQNSNQYFPVYYTAYAGKYKVIITDNNGCQKSWDKVQIFENDEIEYDSLITFSPSPPSYCITLTPRGGIAPYTHSWFNGATTPMICGLTPGIYCDTIRDALGCMKIACITIVPLSIVTSHNDVCYSQDSGWACVQTNGGCPNFHYQWTSLVPGFVLSHPLDTLPCISNVPGGEYKICVNDGCGDTKCDTVTIGENPQILASFLIDTVSCGGGSDGSLTITASGGTPFTDPPGYHFLWSNGSATNTASGLTAGNYSVTVTDSIGCPRAFTVVMPQPPPLGVAFITGSTDQCATYLAQANVTGGNTPYSYLWSNSQTTNPATGLVPGTYTVTVTDVKSCQKVGSVTITALSVTTIAQDVLCHGACNGTASATPAGGNPPYIVTWTKVPSGEVIPGNPISGLCPGDYMVTVVDSNNCAVTKTVSIMEPSNSLVINSLVFKFNRMEPCYGDCKEEVTAYVSGGTPAYQFEWKNLTTNVTYGVTTNKITNLCAGQYKLTVKDFNNCIKDTTFTINQPPELKIIRIIKTDINCYTDGDVGKIIIDSLTGGVSPFVYSIHCPTANSYVGSNTFTNLPPAVYAAGVMDINGCPSVCTPVTISRPPALVVVPSGVYNPTGFGSSDGSITTVASGGTPPYNHYWYKAPDTFLPPIQPGNFSTLSNLTAGVYMDTVVDAHGCKTGRTVTLVEPSELIVVVDSSHISCFGAHDGKIKITVSGGVQPYVFTWSTGRITSGQTTDSIYDLSAGSRSVTIKDFHNVVKVRTVLIIEPNPILINFTTNPVCFGETSGQVIAVPSQGTPPFAHHWNNGLNTATITNLPANQWYVDTVTDIRGCKAIDSVFLPENPQLFVHINNIDSTVCKGSSIQMNVDAYGGIYPYTFAWIPVSGVSKSDTLEPLITPVFPETYVITMTDSKQCKAKDSITINIDSLPAANFTYLQVCQSRTVQFTNLSTGYPTSALDYLWDFGDGEFSVIKNPEHTFSGPFGSYNVSLTVTSPEGCTHYMMKLIEINPIIQAVFHADTACLGTETQFWAQSLNPATAVSQLKWYFDNQPPVTVVPPPYSITHTFSYAGIHSVKLVMTDSTGCSDSVINPVSVLPSPATEFTYTWHVPAIRFGSRISPRIRASIPPIINGNSGIPVQDPRISPMKKTRTMSILFRACMT